VQALADRLDKALKRFFRCGELGQKAGFPRFKGANRRHSIRLRQYGPGRDVYLDPDTGRLRVPKKLGSFLEVKRPRALEGAPQTAHRSCSEEAPALVEERNRAGTKTLRRGTSVVVVLFQDMNLVDQLKLRPTREQARILEDTLGRANAACDHISKVAWERRIFGKYALQDFVTGT
jgi:hypothetical protein